MTVIIAIASLLVGVGLGMFVTSMMVAGAREDECHECWRRMRDADAQSSAHIQEATP